MSDDFTKAAPGARIIWDPVKGAEPTEGEFLGVSQKDHRGQPTVIRVCFGKGAQLVDAKAVRLA